MITGFTGQHGFITGGASGIGLAIADALAAQGAAITIADFDAERLDALDRPYQKLCFDVRDAAGWESARQAAEQAQGPVTLLINNAGIGPNRSEIADMDAAIFERMIAIKLNGSFLGCRTFAPGMRARRSGHIVNTASMAALRPMARLGEYSAAKAGLAGLTRVLRLELAPHDVGVSLLCPGMVATSLPVTLAKVEGRYAPEMAGQLMPGIAPEHVAGRVLAGILNNAPIILTHGEHKGDVAVEMETILTAFDDTPNSGEY